MVVDQRGQQLALAGLYDLFAGMCHSLVAGRMSWCPGNVDWFVLGKLLHLSLHSREQQ